MKKQRARQSKSRKPNTKIKKKSLLQRETQLSHVAQSQFDTMMLGLGVVELLYKVYGRRTVTVTDKEWLTILRDSRHELSECAL
jgi:hypothetical protein